MSPGYGRDRTRTKRILRLENQMIRTVSFGKLQKITPVWPVVLPPCHSFVFMHKISTREQGSFLHEHARPLNKQCAWRLTTGSAFIKMARLKAIVAIIFLVDLGECARDLTKCVVCKKL